MATFNVKNAEKLRTVTATIASATVIAPKRLVGVSSGLIVDADSTSTKVAYTPSGSADGETTIEVSVGNDFTLVGTGDTNFAVTNKGSDVDLTDSQEIDLGTSSTKVLSVDISENAGTAGSDENITVRINKPLF